MRGFPEEDVTEELEKVHVRTLIVRGDGDEIVRSISFSHRDGHPSAKADPDTANDLPIAQRELQDFTLVKPKGIEKFMVYLWPLLRCSWSRGSLAPLTYALEKIHMPIHQKRNLGYAKMGTDMPTLFSCAPSLGGGEEAGENSEKR